MTLIVFGGLPGVGKTTLSRAVAQQLAMTWLRIDAIEAAMWRAGNDEAYPTGIGAYAVAHAVASAQLDLHPGVVVDAVNPVEAARQGWRDLAAKHNVPLYLIEVICSDLAEHRRRVEGRLPEVDQPRVPSWEQVMSWGYEPWTGSRLVIDTAHDIDRCIKEALSHIQGQLEGCAATDSRHPR